jgi:hypothetical protein
MRSLLPSPVAKRTLDYPGALVASEEGHIRDERGSPLTQNWGVLAGGLACSFQ